MRLIIKAYRYKGHKVNKFPNILTIENDKPIIFTPKRQKKKKSRK
jgi:hypothetical protein